MNNFTKWDIPLKERLEYLKEEIRSCGFYDLVMYAGKNKPGTPLYTPKEQEELQVRKMNLENELFLLGEKNE